MGKNQPNVRQRRGVLKPGWVNMRVLVERVLRQLKVSKIYSGMGVQGDDSIIKTSISAWNKFIRFSYDIPLALIG